ncbi:hypothetical protein [Streptomyces sp. NPDC086010]|uniref:hypothetical protein n=1 Tax=Streptomyces sp. NPDC086010 TaxID=3365745 RepID=UPI0037D3AB2C
MLQVNPKMISRLDDLRADLVARLAHAQTEGWAGEIEGLDLTLQLLRAKCQDAQLLAHRPPIELGIPQPRQRGSAQSSADAAVGDDLYDAGEVVGGEGQVGGGGVAGDAVGVAMS